MKDAARRRTSRSPPKAARRRILPCPGQVAVGFSRQSRK
ncbi:unnamed protein product [Ciceribacter sp. T2.26MG-112.2]|nr:unnamed protein product [Ciceribacter naphthalenivorans]